MLQNFRERILMRVVSLSIMALVLAALMLAITPAPAAQAAGTVSDCTAFGGNVNRLQSKLMGGGFVNFTCSGNIVIPNQIIISENTTIDGGGQTITLNGNNATRVFWVKKNATLTFRNITVTRGKDMGMGGAAIYNEGGKVNVINSTLSFNTSSTGGAINNSNFGTLTLTGTTLVGNSAQTRGGAIYNNASMVEATKSLFLRNTADHGGAIYNNGKQVTASNSTFHVNSAARGGAVFHNAGEFVMINNTMADNNATIANTGGNIFNNVPSGLGSLRLSNTLVKTNSAGGNCAGNPVNNNGFNLQFPGVTCGTTIPSLDPMLKPLTSNGGPTQTMSLNMGSPAIDKGSNFICAAAPINNLDQRGAVRPVDGNGDSKIICDIGAYEL